MAKKQRKQRLPQLLHPQKEPIFTPVEKKMIGTGGGLLLIGFILLTRTDPYGRNWASHIFPFLILGAYIFILAGLLIPEFSKNLPTSETIFPPMRDQKTDSPE